MIQANELRVGNRVFSSGVRHTTGLNPYPLTVSSIGRKTVLDEQFVTFEETVDRPINLTSLQPIPLTPELLEKCGFEQDKSQDDEERAIYGIQVANNTSLYFDPHNAHMRNDEYVEWYLSHEWNNNHFKNDFWARPKYLHQLQNLYFALTGEELKVNL